MCLEAQNETTGIAVAMEKYKVLFIHKFFTTGGGVERVHKNLSQALNDEGVTSIFYVHDVTGESKEGFSQLQDSFTAFAADSNNGFKQKLSYLYSLIKRKEINVIIAATETANILAFLCRLCGVSMLRALGFGVKLWASIAPACALLYPKPHHEYMYDESS